MQSVVIKQRFCGPPNSGNGGYSCGLLAEHISGPAQVRLHSPPPLDTPLTIIEDSGDWLLKHQRELVGTAKPAQLDLVPPSPPTLEQARQARQTFAGHSDLNVFRSCFVCGPARDVSDGLQLFTGNINGTELVACDWQPNADLLDEQGNTKTEFVWSALDCPGYFALRIPSDSGKLFLLGQMTGSIDKPVPGDQPLIIYAWTQFIEGRKHYSASAIATAEGEVLARAEHLWIELKQPALEKTALE